MPPTPPKFSTLIEPQQRGYIEWSVDLMKVAEINADRGNLRLAADFCDFILGDDRASTVLSTRVQGLLGLPIDFEASGDGRKKSKAVKALELEDDWWEIFPEAEHAFLRTYAILLGVCPAQLAYDEESDANPDKRVPRYRPAGTKDRLVPKLSPWHPRGLQRDPTTLRWTLATQDGSRVDVIPGNGMWVLDAPYGLNRPWLFGKWRGAGVWRMAKHYAIRDRGRLGEKAAALSVETGADVKSTKELRKELAQSMYELGRDGVIAPPPGHVLKLIETTAATHQIYKDQIDDADDAFTAMFLGHESNSGVSKGTQTGSTAGETIRYDLRKFDATSDEGVTRNQVLIHWAEQNFGQRQLAPYPHYQVDPPADKAARTQEYNALGDGLTKLRALEPRVDVVTILEEHEIPLLAHAPEPKPGPTPPPVPPHQPPHPGAPPASPAGGAPPAEPPPPPVPAA